jgi:hypothetical protein
MDNGGLVSYTLGDPRPLKEENPYTFFEPLAYLLEQLRIGDSVKLIFIADPPSRQWGAERMWVKITAIDSDDRIEGTLNNAPRDLPALKPGDVVQFFQYHIVDFQFDENNCDPPINYDEDRFPKPREYWERCIVDDAIVKGELKVEHIERQVPGEISNESPTDGTRGLSDEEIAGRPYSFVALGVVLNKDDSWIEYIDCPVGSSYTRNWKTGLFEKDEFEN